MLALPPCALSLLAQVACEPLMDLEIEGLPRHDLLLLCARWCASCPRAPRTRSTVQSGDRGFCFDAHYPSWCRDDPETFAVPDLAMPGLEQLLPAPPAAAPSTRSEGALLPFEQVLEVAAPHNNWPPEQQRSHGSSVEQTSSKTPQVGLAGRAGARNLWLEHH